MRNEGAKLWEKYPNEQRLVDVKVAGTDHSWRRKGIMNRLVEEIEYVLVFHMKVFKCSITKNVKQQNSVQLSDSFTNNHSKWKTDFTDFMDFNLKKCNDNLGGLTAKE